MSFIMFLCLVSFLCLFGNYDDTMKDSLAVPLRHSREQAQSIVCTKYVDLRIKKRHRLVNLHARRQRL